MPAVSPEFADEMRAPLIEDMVSRIEREVRRVHPEVVALFVKPRTHKGLEENIQRNCGSEASDTGSAGGSPAPDR